MAAPTYTLPVTAVTTPSGVAYVATRENHEASVQGVVNALNDKIEPLEGLAEGGNLTTATWSQLSAITGTRANQRADVLTDAGTHTDPVVGGTVDNEGVYAWSTSPAGWERVGNLADDAVLAEVLGARGTYDSLGDRFDGIDAVLDAVVNYVETVQRIGKDTTPVTGTNVGIGTFVLDEAVTDGGAVSCELWSNVEGSMTIGVWSKAGDDFTRVASAEVSTSIGLNTFTAEDLGLTAEPGQYVGFGGTTAGRVASNIGTTTFRWYSTPSGTSTAFTDAASSNTSTLQFAVNVTHTEVIPDTGDLDDRLTTVETVLDEIVTYVETVQRIGKDTTPVTGSSADAGTYVFAEPVTDGGAVAASFWSEASGSASLGLWTKAGNDFTRVAATVVAASVGLNTFSAEDLGLTAEPGQYLGFGSTTEGALASVVGASPDAWYSAPDGSTTAFTDSGATTVSALQLSFVVTKVSPVVTVGGDGVSDIVARSNGRFTHQLNLINNTGQSLAEGSDGAITTAQEYDNVAFAARSTSPTVLYPLTVANAQYSSRGEFPGIGTAGMIKQLIRDELNIPYTENDYQLVVCNNGYSGFNIAELNEGTTPYTRAVSQAAALKAIGDVATRTAAYQATLWVQGEGDLKDGTTQAAYLAALEQLAEDYADDAKASTEQLHDPILIAAQTSTAIEGTAEPDNRSIALAQLQAADHPLIYLACPMYQLDFYDDLHIDAASAKWLGGYFGIVYTRVVIEGKDWQPLRPVRHSVLGNTIDLFFNRNGLVFDTSIVPAQTNYGFTVANAADSAQTISSVEIVGPNRVRLTMATTPAAGWKVRYGFNVAADKSPFLGGCGNLRDRQGDRLTFAGNRMDNWCVIFEYLV